MNLMVPLRVVRPWKAKQKNEETEMKKVIMGIALAALATGCQTTVYKNDGGDADLRPTIVRDIAYEKYEVKSTLTESKDIRVGILGGLFVFGQVPDHYADNAPKGWFDKKLVAVAKNAAYANACKAADCDSLVGTRYEIKYNDYFVWQKVLVTVKGYPAKLTGVEFHKANLDCPCAKK